MRVVYDTSVLATLTRREELVAFKAAATSKQLTPITSLYILEELERVLTEKFGLTKQKARITVRVFAKLSIVVYPRHIEKVCRDPHDDYILATAAEGGADYIVTADKDLLVLKVHKEARIIRASELKKLITDGAGR